MTYQYISDPQQIETESFRKIRRLTNLDGWNEVEQQVVMRIIHSVGIPEVVEDIRLSEGACQQGMMALQANSSILCDVEMVRHGLTKRFLAQTPLCFLNHPEVITLAKQNSETRTMAALQFWQPYLEGSIVIIGNAPTALFRLLEMIKAGADKPALVIGIPVGFVGAAESKQALWDDYQNLGINCITVLGRQGGSAIAASVCNALMRCLRNEFY